MGGLVQCCCSNAERTDNSKKSVKDDASSANDVMIRKALKDLCPEEGYILKRQLDLKIHTISCQTIHEAF